MLTMRRVGRQRHAHRRAAVLAGLDLDAPAESPGLFLDVVVARPAPLARAVVRDHRLDAPVLGLGHADRDSRRRPAPQRLVNRLADALVEADARVLRQRLARLDVEADLDPVREPDL